MKNAILLFTILSVMLSCSKEKESVSDLPKWLQERITADEKEIEANPQSGLDIAAWVQYTYHDAVYFEYVNLLSSSFPKIFTYAGVELDHQWTEYQDYNLNKCCKKYVWKGKSYFED